MQREDPVRPGPNGPEMALLQVKITADQMDALRTYAASVPCNVSSAVRRILADVLLDDQ